MKLLFVGPLIAATLISYPETFVFASFAFMKAASYCLFILPLGIMPDYSLGSALETSEF